MTSITTILTTFALVVGLSFSTPAENTGRHIEFIGPPVRVGEREVRCQRPCIYNEQTGKLDCPCP